MKLHSRSTTGYLLFMKGLASFARSGALVMMRWAGEVREKLREWEESWPAERRSSLDDNILTGACPAGRECVREVCLESASCCQWLYR